MVLVAMLAIGLVVVVPVAASEFSQSVGEEITQDSELEAESGDGSDLRGYRLRGQL
jgi:hypothetical protein